MRRAVIALVSALIAVPAIGATKTPIYYSAESYFNDKYSLRERVVAQVMLIAAGHQNIVPTESLQLKTFEGTRDFQAVNGLQATGLLDRPTLNRLFESTRPLFDLWDFQEVGHPARGRPIWIPQGMGVQRIITKNGVMFKEPNDRFQVSYNFYSGQSSSQMYEWLLGNMQRSGTRVHYSAIKDGWFVISATTLQGFDEYLRYHDDGTGTLGFTAIWNNEKGVVSGERIAVLMSASLGSVMNGRPFVEPPRFAKESAPAIAAAPTVVPATRSDPDAVIAPNPPPPAIAAPVPKTEDKVSTGSGFFIDGKGHLITNAHVIDECKTIVVKTLNGQVREAKVSAVDAVNDLALLQIEDGSQAHFAKLRYGARLGEGISTFGFPHADTLAGGGNFTLGNVTALAGIKDDSRFYQISAPVQRGNSGGPMLDGYGNVVGVVTSKLNTLKVALQSGDFPQNINFAIKGSHLASFLESNGVAISIGTVSEQKLNPEDLADLAKNMSVFIVCR